MKHNGLVIMAIILLTIIVFCLTIFLVSYLKGNMIVEKRVAKSTDIVFDQTFEVAEMKSIEILQEAGDVILQESPNDKIQVLLYGESENDVKVNFYDDKLVIANTYKKGFHFFDFGIRKNDIIIYIPSNYSQEIKIKNDYGKCEIVDLEEATVDIDCDAGNVELGKIKNAIIKCDYGNVEVNEVLKQCNIKVDCGNVEIEKAIIQENSAIEVNLGNINIQEINEIYVDANVELGKTNIKDNHRNADISIQINCDCGNIAVGK